MPNPEHIDVKVDEVVKFGVFANAFRVIEEAGPDCFLDFMVYSATEREATVVARVRVRRDFLDGIKAKLKDAMETFSEDSQDDETRSVACRKAKGPFH